eukprot:Gregarina_sp_Poly_1__10160@NODE_697_length_6711_cov_200_540036_g525_i0_p4_GENE_NODE_697_length_6711_cov_200_540036_g525_i0NODE_697_length_6711_cov_200_540036_g525_i0_p4_ORF_typecomplete_len316_score37_77Homoserine_dh/PF00742_19/3_3e26NAD_binding_3/PF03447_16/2_4e14GFO_IDH_MocA/PF01408_22/0_00035NAD_binding_2/PF03446_15/0_0028DapB_N/PF01113_20/0_01Sacchrp_dh_NADP/PF03435_18/0_061_NODE_697_length_6711_cov_200_540036_g525_i014512398
MMSAHRQTLRVGLFGLGCVGQGLVRVLRGLREYRSEFFIYCRNPKKLRPLEDLGDLHFVNDVNEILKDSSNLDVIVELIGGADGVAYEIVTRALQGKIPVVTANKALLAAHLDEIENLLSTHQNQIYFEGSVCGGVPVLQTLQNFHNSLCDSITRIEGIVNGSTNYLLWRLEEDSSVDYVSMIVDMTSRGYLEADPSQDLEAIDARSKIQILARLGFRTNLHIDDIACFGIPDLQSGDWLHVSNHYEGTIRLIATIRRVDGDGLFVCVMPAIVKKTSQFGMIKKNNNCVRIVSDLMGVWLIVTLNSSWVPDLNLS